MEVHPHTHPHPLPVIAEWSPKPCGILHPITEYYLLIQVKGLPFEKKKPYQDGVKHQSNQQKHFSLHYWLVDKAQRYNNKMFCYLLVIVVETKLWSRCTKFGLRQ